MSNTLLLMSDEHNPRYCPVYGHPFLRTPVMAGLARRGTVYENAYCPSPLCMPCRSAFMSGRRVHEIQAYSNCSARVAPDIPSYGAALARRGVHAAYIGKTHVYAPGDRLGFSEMILPGDATPPGDTNHRRNPLQIRPGAAQRADRFGPHEEAGRPDRRRIDAAVAWLTTRAASIEGPWVLVVNLTNPHFPHYVTQDLWDLYPEGGDLPAWGPDCVSANHPHALDLRAHFETEAFTEAHIRGQRRGYLGCVTFVDRQLGRLIDALKASGRYGTTNIVYTSDHGEMLGKFGMWWKCCLYEDAVRVPIIAAGPDFREGARVSTPVDLHDLRAGLFASAGIEQPAGWIGTPLRQLPDEDPERVVFSEYHGHGTRTSAYMIRQGRWKYIHYVRAPHQLFDLETDPEELHNLYDARPEVVQRLEAALRRICDPEAENDRAERFIERQLVSIA